MADNQSNGHSAQSNKTMKNPKNGELSPFLPSTLVQGHHGKDERVERETWAKKTEYILSSVGYCVGLGNVWRFPYVCIRNGGGAFLIPFFICLTVSAMPLFYLEASLGQFSRMGPYGVWSNICPLFKGIGVSMIFLCVLVSWYYSMILAYTLIYLVNSCKEVLPWTLCDQYWNTNRCVTAEHQWLNSTSQVLTNVSSLNNSTFALESGGFYSKNSSGVDYFNQSTIFNTENVTNFISLINQSDATNNVTMTYSTSSSEEFWLYNVLEISSGLHEMGSLPWHTITALIVSNICVLLGVIRGIKSSGKVVYVTATLPYILLTALIIRGCLLPGAMGGILFYVMPDMGKLLKVQTWLEAAIQVFYSLGPTYGCIITMASYNTFHNNIQRDSVWLAFACEGTSVFAGFAIFSVLGHMAHTSQVPIANFTSSGPGLAFVVYPQAIALLPAPQIWGVLFFLMLFSLGLDSQFCNVESIITSAADIWPKFVPRYRTTITSIFVGSMTLLCIPFTMQGGMYVFQLIDWYVAAFTVLLIGALETLVVGWIYGGERILDDIEMMIGHRPHRLFLHSWKIFTPAFLFIVLVGTLATYETPVVGSYHYPPAGIFLGWCFAMISFLPVPVCALRQIYISSGSCLRQRIERACKPSLQWMPSLKGSNLYQNQAASGDSDLSC